MVEELEHRQVAAEELRVAMARRQMSQSDMARATGISMMTVSRHYRAVTPMSAYQQDLYAHALDMHWTTNEATGLPRLDSNQQPFGIQTGPRADSLVGAA